MYQMQSSKHDNNQDAHRNGWVWLQIKKNVKNMKSEINKNIQGANSEGKETGTQINDLEQKEEIIIQAEQKEKKQEFEKWGEA